MKQIFTILALVFFATTMFAQTDMLLNVRHEKTVNEHFERQQEFKLLQKHEKESTKTTYKGAANEQDSLALVALYNATDGDNWSNKDNWLTGNVADWYGITLDENGRVSQIDLSDNKLTGSIPTEIGNLTNLTSLFLYHNELTGSIPTEIGNLTNLTSLFLSTNELTGSIPAEIGNLVNLEKLYLYNNELTGSIPTEIGNLTNLSKLQMYENQLTGIPAEIGNLTNLTSLDLSDNQLTGIPAEIGNLTNLTSLNLSDNKLTGSILTEIGNLTNLTSLNLSENKLTGSIPTEIGNLTNLIWLTFDENKLTGSIPTEIGNLTNLAYLSLKYNKLTGSIPAEIGNLTNLTYFYLKYNQLTGSIPAEIGNLTNLSNLNLMYNQLTGSIPTEIGNLTRLHYLYFNNNYLTGSIPTEIVNFKNLIEVLLYNNQFLDLPDLSSLTISNSFKIYNNQFTFEDIEPNINVGSPFSYSPQAKIGDVEHFTPSTGETINLSVTVGGSANTYQWYKDDVEISEAVNNIYIITDYSESDKGVYMCKISNTIATELILESNNKYVGIDVQTFNISATENPTEGGTVTGAGTYEDGAIATLTATANTGYNFVNWTSKYNEVSNHTDINFTVTSDTTIVANFELQSFTVSATANPTECGTINGAETYNFGETATLTATANTGYNFVNWTSNGTEVSTDTTYSFTVTSDTTLVANFVEAFDVSATANPTAGGTITGAETYNDGATATLTATANTGYNFVNWTSNGTEVSTDTTYSFTVTSDTALVANFELQSLIVSASANSTVGGTVTGAGTYNYGETDTLTATANIGYNFVNWTSNGIEVSTDTTYSFTVISDTTIVANFELQSFTVSASANPIANGTITGAGTYDYGATATLTATANTGYSFVNWTSGTTEVSTDITYSFTVISDTTIVANFELQSFTVSATANPTIGGTVSGADTYDYGETANLSATANTGYSFVNWTSDTTEISTDTTYSFTVTSDTIFVANFEEKTSIAEFGNQMSFVVYPNPAKDIVNIQLNNFKVNNAQNIQITMFDYLGKISNVNTKRINSGNIKIDVSNKPAGIYFLRISENNGLQKMCKFIVIK